MSVAKNLSDLIGAGELIDTALVPDDDDPTFDDDGMTFTRPGLDADDIIETLEDPAPGDESAELAPGEAEEVAAYSHPLTKDEKEALGVLDFENPEQFTWVDDPAHDDRMYKMSKKKMKAMDELLQDEVFGQGNTDESGLSLSSLARTVKKGVTTAAKATGRTVARVATGVVKKFVPNRDVQKAALVKQTNARLVNGRMGFLATQDRKHGIRRPKAAYAAQAKSWAATKLKAGGLPTSYSSGEILSLMGGTAVMGSWWNPFSWFQSRTKYVIQNAQGEMVELSDAQWNALQAAQALQQSQMDPNAGQPGVDPNADPNAQYSDPNAYVDPNAAYVDPSAYVDPNAQYADPSAQYAYADPNAQYADPNAAYYDPNQYGATMGDQHNDANDSLIFGDDPDYDFVVGDGAKDFAGVASEILSPTGGARQISADKFKALVLRRAQKKTGQTTPTEAALLEATRRVQRHLAKKGVTVTPPPGVTSSGAWLYQLDPRYWMKSPRERRLIDAEKSNWEKTRELGKRTGKQKGELEAGRRAAYQAEQAHAAEAESQAVETELADIEQSLSSSGSSIGEVAVQILGEAVAEGKKAASSNKKKCGALAAKLDAGQKLTPEEIGKLRSCLKMCHLLRKLHAELHKKATGGAPVSTSGENVQEILGGIRGRMGNNSGPNDILGGLPQQTWIELTAVAASQPQNLPKYMSANRIQLTKVDLNRLRAATANAKKIMATSAYKQARMHPSVMVGKNSLDGDDSSSMGFSFTKLLTAPLALAALPAAALSWGATKIVQAPTKLIQYGARKGGWTTPGTGYRPPAPAQLAPGQIPGAAPPGAPPAAGPMPMPAPASVPQASMPGPTAANQALVDAARARRAAAYQRQLAAQAQSAEAQRQLQANADAANAEADALEAEAQARADAEDAADADAGIPPADTESGNDREVVNADGNRTMVVLGADWFSGIDVTPIGPQERKVILAAMKDDATGKKIRAGATLYKNAKGGHKPSRIAIAKLQQKAKTGDPQAKRDYNAVKAGKIAVHAKGKAAKHVAKKSLADARKKRFVAGQRRMEAALADKLARGTRRRKLAKLAKVEHRAAHGDKKARVAIAKVVAKANKGDKKAKTTVHALRLVKHVRQSAKTPQEARRIKAAGKVYAKARKGNKKAIRQVALIMAASNKGQPNAKRARHRLETAARLERAVATGKVVLGTPKVTPHSPQGQAAAKKEIARIRGRVTSGIATQEEALRGAKIAHAAGLKDEAAQFAMEARKLRPMKQSLKETAAVQAAAESGHKEAQATISDTLAAASKGDPKGIASAGKMAAVKTIADLNKGGSMSPQVAEAMHIAERAQAGDPEAKTNIANVGLAAQNPEHPNHEKAVEAAVALTAAGALLGATAANAGARKKVRDKANEAMGLKTEPHEVQQTQAELNEKLNKLRTGEGTYADGVEARNLAMALGKPRVAAEISAIMPPADLGNPLSSLTGHRLPPITGWGSFLKESLKAIFLATDDPLENYHQGVRDRGAPSMVGPIGPGIPGMATHTPRVMTNVQRGRKTRSSGDDEAREGTMTQARSNAEETKAKKILRVVDRKVNDGSAGVAELQLGVKAANFLGDAGRVELYQGILTKLIPAKM